MSLSCSRCERSIDVVGERPSFCPYCGQPIPGSTPPSRPSASTEPAADATIDYHRPESTVAYVGTPTSIRGVPEQVAGYRLIRKLGQGGMGSVHEDEEMASGRRVALKLMAPEYTTSATAVERFLQEGRLASSIAHPRCVFVLAADRSDGWPFIVMELMPGHTLKDLVEREGPLPQGEAVRKILDVIEGLQEAHKLGVIHRDVKPSNCFLDADGRVKVGDFGLSKSLLGSDADLTRTGAFLGTPHYASPEQIKGELIDERSDVYSVAATLYYLLTGGPPHQASEATVALARIVSEQAPSVRTIRPEVWSALDEAVMRGLERDRRRRYRNLEDFREALAPFLPGRVALGRFGLRATAYAFDFLVTFTIIMVVIVIEAFARRMGRSPFDFPASADNEVLTGLIVFAYFLVFEVLGSASPGKRILRLRVVSSRRGGTAGWWESIVRLLTFATIVILPRRIYTLGFAHSGEGRGTILSIASVIQMASIPVLFITARAKNGYRAVHELLSGTAVVLLPASLRRRVGSRGHAKVEEAPRLLRPDGLPHEVGPYRVAGALAWEPGRRVLLGEDVGLGRTVWIVLRPPDSEPIGETRREVGRLARPRWLGTGEVDEWAWDAFVAPGGQPLPDLIARRGRLLWHEARGVLEDLATELVAACDDGTLPEGLSPGRVWIQPDGRVFLIDGLIDPRHGQTNEIVHGDPERRALGLLREV
ncbi:MAG TPA: protein kinase, partial [Isosphaeraceae bacterium]